MNYMIILVQILLALSFTASRRIAEEENYETSKEVQDTNKLTSDSQEKVNDFVDVLLNSFTNMVKVARLQPLEVPDTRKKFGQNVLGIRWHGEASLFNGSIAHGLGTVARVGDADVSKSATETHTTKTITFEFELQELQIDSNFVVQFMNLGPNGDFTATCENLKVHISISIITPIHKSKDIKIKLEKVEIVDLAPFKLVVRGVWPFNYLVEIMGSLMSKIFNKLIVRVVQKQVEELLNQALKNVGDSPSAKFLISKSFKFL